MSAVLPALLQRFIIDLVLSDRPFEDNAEHQRCEYPGEPNFCKPASDFYQHCAINLFQTSSAQCSQFELSLQLQTAVYSLHGSASLQIWEAQRRESMNSSHLSDFGLPTFLTTADNIPVSPKTENCTACYITGDLCHSCYARFDILLADEFISDAETLGVR